MMETDDRDCATCQNPREGTQMELKNLFNDNRTKNEIMSSPTIKGEKNGSQ